MSEHVRRAVLDFLHLPTREKLNALLRSAKEIVDYLRLLLEGDLHDHEITQAYYVHLQGNTISSNELSLIEEFNRLFYAGTMEPVLARN